MSRKNPLYESLIRKSLDSMLSAIELYNKPCFSYREEVFAILAVNSWELLLKSYLLKLKGYKPKAIYEMEPKKNKDGSHSRRQQIPKKNRIGNPMTLSIFKVVSILFQKGLLPNNVKLNIESLIELRDNAIHFVNTSNSFGKQIQELGFACIKNYIEILKQWGVKIDLSQYNFYLMPLAYVERTTIVDAVTTEEECNYARLLQDQLENEEESGYDIAISIDIQLKRGNSIATIGMHYDGDGVPICLTEENIRQRFPWDYNTLCSECRKRYSDFKQNNVFHILCREELKTDNQLYHARKLDPGNPKSAIKGFYSANVWNILDRKYTQK